MQVRFLLRAHLERLQASRKENGIRTFAFWLSLLLASVAHAEDLSPQRPQPQIAALSARLLGQYHYKPQALDDQLSEKIFSRYLDQIDPERYFFTQDDVTRLSTYRQQLDDAILRQNLSAPFEMFNLYRTRALARFELARTLLQQPIDFSLRDSIQISRDKEAWPANEGEIRELWRKRVKSDWLNLKLSGKKDSEVAEALERRYQNSIRRISGLRSEDVFQSFMNAYLSAIEPHTGYLGPRNAENFEINMKLSLVGIGAILEERDGQTIIKELVAGGPAALSGKLKLGDRIIGVAQGREGTITDVNGWRIDDTVRLIRGEEDTVVLLNVQGADNPVIRQVSLVRKKITLRDQAASQRIITLTEQGVTRRIGVISLPSFYRDFGAQQRGEREFKSATNDVRDILKALKRDKVDSVLIDLRNNGGGSLTEAVELTGLFIDQGPVVQQRDAKGSVKVESDADAGVAWSGPLSVLINRNSASASEIFAAAMQDYGRGLIIGERSFGKGTVQSMLDLDRVFQSSPPVLGEVKVTVAQFFRINGDTTQLQGVTPDIRFATATPGEKIGEATYDNALPAEKIPAANYTASKAIDKLLPRLRERHETRIKTDKPFTQVLDNVADIQARRKANQLSLNEAERRRDNEQREARLGKGTAIAEENDTPPPANGEAKAKPADALLDEAVRITRDYVELAGKEVGLAAGLQRRASKD